jgi:cytochrome oxidase Cu insertion factor (SCO1/SenC/PrrC family)
MWRLVTVVEIQGSDLRESMGQIKRTRLVVLTALSVVVLSLAACSGGGQQSGTNAERAGSSSEGSEDFSVTTLEGERFNLSKKQGEVVALYFMAGW